MVQANKSGVAYYEYDACLPVCAPNRCDGTDASFELNSHWRLNGQGFPVFARKSCETGQTSCALAGEGRLNGQGGNIMTEAGTWSSPYCFATKERDYEGKSGLIYFGARYYSPELGRWTQRDPAGTVDGLNLYLYVNNGPLNRRDPWGFKYLPTRIDIGVYVYRAGPAWPIEIFPFLSRRMCHYWIEVEGLNWRVDNISGVKSPIPAPTMTYKKDAKWPLYWDHKRDRWLKPRGQKKTTCNCINATDIFDCIQEEASAESFSCVTFVWRVKRNCCLVQGDYIYDNPFADPVEWPGWPDELYDTLTNPKVFGPNPVWPW